MKKEELRRAGITDTEPLPAAIIVLASLGALVVIVWGLWRAIPWS